MEFKQPTSSPSSSDAYFKKRYVQTTGNMKIEKINGNYLRDVLNFYFVSLAFTCIGVVKNMEKRHMILLLPQYKKYL
jgi:hypothetical protein